MFGKGQMLLVAPGLVAACMAACATGPSQLDDRPRQVEDMVRPVHKEVVNITEPIVIGFFPPVTDTEVQNDPGIASALDHFTWALDETEKCLLAKHIQAREIHANVIVFKNGGTEDKFLIRDTSNESIGCYLVAPGRQPRVIRATAGPSSLVTLCPVAASFYFDVPACCPSGLRCCPDGSTMSEENQCDG